MKFRRRSRQTQTSPVDNLINFGRYELKADAKKQVAG